MYKYPAWPIYGRAAPIKLTISQKNKRDIKLPIF